MTAWWALAFVLTYVTAAFGLRTLQHRHRTGDTGFRALTGRRFSAEWWAGILFGAAILAAVAGPVAALAGLPVLDSLDQTLIRAVGIAISVIGFTATVISQTEMGSSWRIGVNRSERTELVTRGVFRWVRNPIFTAMTMTTLGLFLWIPNRVTLAAALLLASAAELQVRAVEEPHLRGMHARAYADYAATVGRFLPSIGRDRTGPEHSRHRHGSTKR